MNPTVEIFSQGEEVVTGQVADTNAAWLSQQLIEIGFNVSRHTAVGDRLGDLVSVLNEIANRSDCCICSGGLGPTSDDLTAEAVSQAFNLPLQFDEVAFSQIKAYFLRKNRTMPDLNRKQAMLPLGSRRIDNTVGSAPGFCLQYQKCWFVFLPGVPTEMQHLFAETVVADLKTRFALAPLQRITIKTSGIGESELQERINQLILPENVQIGFRACITEVHTKLVFPNAYPAVDVSALVTQVLEKLGEAVFAVEGFDT
jgi:competence/damage-inducible protein CinA-like protein